MASAIHTNPTAKVFWETFSHATPKRNHRKPVVYQYSARQGRTAADDFRVTEGKVKDKKNGAGNETRTRDFHLGKVALYQLSYSRSLPVIISGCVRY